MMPRGHRSLMGVAVFIASMCPPGARANPDPIPAERPIEGVLWSIIVPALLLILASFATWRLYRRFSR